MNTRISIYSPSFLIRQICVVTFFILIACGSSTAQNFWGRGYKSRTKMYSTACGLSKKWKKKPRTNRKGSYVKEKNVVLSNYTKTTPQPKPKPPAPEVAKTEHKIEKIDDQKLEQLHHKEDQVLVENKLPEPTSEKHEQIRKTVAEKLKTKPDSEPLPLAPLYFTFAEDEFAVVDMEPFLIATEYALQGHSVLIEGHTDDRGADDYNMQLSIKRVQKIRQLMLDMGVPDERISIVGYGETVKKNTNKTTEGRQLNRRIDFTVF
ncbi:OmpA family protein [Fulvivirgaceae bacterium PWU5]|uniref:OmpA family protein n=1 Tax=Dawidia cretensis TaxID=2782350 RepID=A0AAP2DVQ2_9BACT|nr:OmpA family protein [Dawidia cretensis]MBT1708226.1 OmpA family protein [Dawidia cretensis]